jgi:hypothetical protein
MFGLEMIAFSSIFGLEMLKYSWFFALDLKFIAIFALSLNKIVHYCLCYLLS